jgi:peptidoglycan hydrolase-like protein with peptidoglycan-binding domain
VDEGEFEYFDFFSDPSAATEREGVEPLLEDVPPPRRDRAGPSRTADRRVVVRRRIVALSALGLVVLIVLVVALTQGSSGQGSAYRRYLSAVSSIAADSQRLGASLVAVVDAHSSASRKAALAAEIDPLVEQAVGDVTRLQGLVSPATLRPEQEQAVAALDLRIRGLQGLRSSLSPALGGQSEVAREAGLAGEVDDLVTSDLIWEGSVRVPANAVLQANGLAGTFPASRFVADQRSLLRSLRTLLQPAVSTSGSALSLGAVGPAVTSWQTALNAWLKLTAPSQRPLTADGTFGPGTEAATRALQTAAGITPDGIVGPGTRRALRDALAGRTTPPTTSGSPALTLGARGPDVVSWQTQLNRWLEATTPSQQPLTPDGTFGPATQRATEALQRAQGLTASGTVDAATRRALQTALAKSPAATG